MKDKVNQMFKDKLFLVMLVLGLLTLVAAAGVVTMRREGSQEQNPYVDMQGQENFLAEEPVEESQISVAGESNARPAREKDTKLAENGNGNRDTAAEEKNREESGTDHLAAGAGSNTAETGHDGDARPVDSGLDAATALVLDFSDTSRLAWPVEGNVLLDYSMDSTIYFPTLDQYKCNPGIVIQGEVSLPVYAPANARVTSVDVNEEIGHYLTLDLGGGYSAVCGQLKEVAAVEGEYLEKGQLIGYVAEPTKYYTIEGSNIYFQLNRDEKPVDPLDYLE